MGVDCVDDRSNVCWLEFDCSRQILQRAEKAGYVALAVTVDAPRSVPELSHAELMLSELRLTLPHRICCAMETQASTV